MNLRVCYVSQTLGTWVSRWGSQRPAGNSEF